MPRFIERPLEQVGLGPGGRPLFLRWRGRSWRVTRTADVWKDVGCWWEEEGEKVFYRLEVDGGRLFEVYLDRRTGKWFLYRVYD